VKALNDTTVGIRPDRGRSAIGVRASGTRPAVPWDAAVAVIRATAAQSQA